jgi:hypothetical protein
VPGTVRLVVGAVSVTDATGAGDGALMTTVADALLPSEVATIVAVPAATPVTRPVALTVASVGSLLDHVTTRPVRVLPLASRSVAIACVDCPTVMAGEFKLIDTVATGASGGAATPIAALAFTPSTVAVMVADPVLTPVTRPVDDTVATVGLELCHITTRSVATVLVESTTFVESWTVPPAAICALDGNTFTDDTGTLVTVKSVAPVTPSVDALIVAVPCVSVVTTPPDETVATTALELVHVNVFPLSATPPASRAVAVNCRTCPDTA